MAKEKEVKEFEGKAHESKGSLKFFQGKAEEIKHEKLVKPAYVVSRLDHPVTISYNGESIIIPPRGRELVANYLLIGAIPKGISVVPKF